METPRPTSPEYSDPYDTANQAAPVPRIEDLDGLFQTQDTVPTTPARKLYEQIRIVNGVVYIYDTANNDWIELSPTQTSPASTYGGTVTVAGAAGTPFPDSWTVSVTGGVYTITHNLGHSNYTVVATISESSSLGYLRIDSRNDDTFVISTYDTSGSSTARAFGFVLQVNG